MNMVQQAIEVSAPLHTVYEQLAAFESYPRFMTGVEQVTSIGNQQTHWVMEVEGRRREFDAQITELSFDERISWTTMDGPRLSETITVRPMGEIRTQVVAQLEADLAFLRPGDRHGQDALNRWLKHDLSTLKGLIESGWTAPEASPGAASSKQLSGRSGTIFGGGAVTDPASPTSIAARIRPKPLAGWDANSSTIADTESQAGNDRADHPDGTDPRAKADVPDTAGRRIAGRGSVRGGAAGAAEGRSGSAPMGGRTTKKDAWGDGMINEEDRGSAHDLRSGG